MTDGPADTGDLRTIAEAASTAGDLAQLLRSLRQRLPDLTYRQVAVRTGWSASTVGAYLTGRTVPSADRFDTLVRLFGATPDEVDALRTARDRVTDGSIGARAEPGPQLTTRQLPGDVPAFTGRAEALTALDGFLRPGAKGRTVIISAVSGAAGVGKTALALHWAHRTVRSFPDGQLYVNLRGFDPGGKQVAPETALRGFLEALGVPNHQAPTTVEGLVNLYRSLLARKRILVVLDNAASADQVRPLLPAAAGCAALITSRDELRHLVVMEDARPLALGVLRGDEAVALLAARLGAERVAAEPAAVDRIVVACARLPLALVVTAARASLDPGVPLSVLADQLETSAANRLDALGSGDPAADIRSVFSWSHQQLSTTAARLFRLIGLHPGPDLDIAAAASLMATTTTKVRSSLDELSRAGLLEEHLPGRYSCHDLLREYATELAATEPPERRTEAVQRILGHYLHSAHDAAMLINPHRDPIVPAEAAPGTSPETVADADRARSWFTREYANLRAAIDCAADLGRDLYTYQLAWALTDFLHRGNGWSDEIATQQMALAAARKLKDPAGQARAHRYLGRAHAHLGRHTEAMSYLQTALRLHAEIGAQTGLARTHLNISWVLDQQERPAEALHHTELALALFESCGHRIGVQYALNGIGWYHGVLGDQDKALAAGLAALAVARELDDRPSQAYTLDTVGMAYHRRGQAEQASEYLAAALTLFQEIGDRYLEADLRTRLGDHDAARGDTGSARTQWRLALSLLEALEHADAGKVKARLAMPD
ncbi:ATP-binding protein [Actinoplanes sp. CA-252034]|uniref:ATP-binding protein n=1 Tax=Actinoplanes sp. CA-252034 TaxID=3239906 RepID=UPI003D9832D2